MRRNQFFQMRPVQRKDANRYELGTQSSYFSQMEPEEISPFFNRRKGTSEASQARRQGGAEAKSKL